MIEKKIDFILVIDIVGMHFHQNREEGIDFTTADDDGLRFVLKPTEPDLDGEIEMALFAKLLNHIWPMRSR